MKHPFLLDTGPLVALLNRNDRYHDWAADQLASIEPPLVTCEAVLTEACHLLRRIPKGPRAVLSFLERGLLTIPLRLEAEAPAITGLMKRYADLPMSIADACLVRLAEMHTRARVLTLDSDFTVYRMHGRKVIPTAMPMSRASG